MHKVKHKLGSLVYLNIANSFTAKKNRAILVWQLPYKILNLLPDKQWFE